MRVRIRFKFGGCLLLCMICFLERHGRFACLVMLITALPILSKIGWWVVISVVRSLVFLEELQLIISDRGVFSALIIASLMSLCGYNFFPNLFFSSM